MIYTLKTEQKIPANLDTVWDFISSPNNLKTITPDYMGFNIISGDLPEKMYKGMIISYKVSPIAGIKMLWVTEITHLSELDYFVDEQRIGPYKLWHHEHKIKEIEGGVLMNDIINYVPPYGILGNVANSLFIEQQLKGIFEYRRRKVEELFGKF